MAGILTKFTTYAQESVFFNKFLDKFTTSKVYVQRCVMYFQLTSWFMLVFMTLKGYNVGLFWTIVISIGGVSIILFIGFLDTVLKVLEREQAHFNQENEAMQLVINTVSKTERLQGKILKRLEEIENKI